MWPYPWTNVGTPSHPGHMDRVAATMPSQAHAGAAQEAPDIGQWEEQDVPLVRPSSCNVKGGIPSSRRYLPTYLCLKTSGLFLSSFLVRVLPPQNVFGVCVRSVPSNRKPFSQPQFLVLFPSLNPVGKKTISIGQQRLRPLLELDTSAIEWLLKKRKSFPCSPEKYDEGYRCIIDPQVVAVKGNVNTGVA